MKHLLLTTIAAVVLVGCGESQQSTPSPETKPDEPVAEVPAPPPPSEANPAEPVAEAAKTKPLAAKAPDISILDAAKAGEIETVKQHLAAGADVDAKDKYGRTPLHLAPASGNKEIAELLIARGADVNAKNKYGVTPLHFAAGYGRKETVELLIAKGADVSAKVVSGPKQGLTPLDAANETSQTKIADLLRKHGGKTGEELKAAGK